jgi:hypothetical protein
LLGERNRTGGVGMGLGRAELAEPMNARAA